jgi:hypothetical protein
MPNERSAALRAVPTPGMFAAINEAAIQELPPLSLLRGRVKLIQLLLFSLVQGLVLIPQLDQIAPLCQEALGPASFLACYNQLVVLLLRRLLDGLSAIALGCTLA